MSTPYTRTQCHAKAVQLMRDAVKYNGRSNPDMSDTLYGYAAFWVLASTDWWRLP